MRKHEIIIKVIDNNGNVVGSRKLNGNMCSQMCNNFNNYPKCFQQDYCVHSNLMEYCKNYKPKK